MQLGGAVSYVTRRPPLTAHGELVWSVAWAADGKALVSAVRRRAGGGVGGRGGGAARRGAAGECMGRGRADGAVLGGGAGVERERRAVVSSWAVV